MQLNSGGGGDAGNKQGLFTVDALAKPTVVLAWILYMQHIFLSDAPCGAAGGEMCGITLPVTNVRNNTAGRHVCSKTADQNVHHCVTKKVQLLFLFMPK